ncbi:MAG: hypothetical protein ACO3RV_05705, partial [Luteolibacter sp.]
GAVDETDVLVMHPAYIGLKKQDLGTYRIGELIELELRPLDDSSLWSGIRTLDDTDSFELMPYLLVADELRHPDSDTSDAKE